jgi:hypothetical protein
MTVTAFSEVSDKFFYMHGTCLFEERLFLPQSIQKGSLLASVLSSALIIFMRWMLGF